MSTRIVRHNGEEGGWLLREMEPPMKEFGVIPPEEADWPMTETLVEKKSTHKAEVVPVVLEKHPDADSLSVVKVFGYTCVCRTADWAGIDTAVFIVPDSVVDVTRPEFAFLAEQAKADGKARIKAKRLRGVVSYGLLVPAPAGANVGDDLAEQLGVERYEPPEPGEGAKEKFVAGGESEEGPPIDTGPSKYDVDAFEVFADKVFTDGEPVALTEKLDGSNARFVYWGGRFWVKSRKLWVKRVPDYSHVTLDSLLAKGLPEEKAREIVERVALRRPQVNGFWAILEKTPALMDYLMANPGTVVFGEVYGSTNRLKYGFPEGNRFAGFDIYRDGKFVDAEEVVGIVARNALPWAPALGLPHVGDYGGGADGDGGVTVPYSFSLVKSLSEGPTTAPGAKPKVIREGVVVRPAKERWDRKLGRVILKCVNPDFLAGN